MKYNEKMLERFADHHLAKFGTSLEKIRKEEGQASKRSKTEPWYIKYAFQNAKEDEEWHNWVKETLTNEYEKLDVEKEINVISMICAPASLYLFKTEPTNGLLF